MEHVIPGGLASNVFCLFCMIKRGERVDAAWTTKDGTTMCHNCMFVFEHGQAEWDEEIHNIDDVDVVLEYALSYKVTLKETQNE